MTKFKKGQKVWVQAVVKDVYEVSEEDLRIEINETSTWLDSTKEAVRTGFPMPPAPVRLFGHTIFDLQNCLEISPISRSEYRDLDLDNEQEYCWRLRLVILRGSSEDYIWFTFDTKEEATAAREVIEKKVMEAKGIDDGQD